MEKEIKKDKTNRRILQEATKKLVEGENEWILNQH
jgi:hypothetical protein